MFESSGNASLGAIYEIPSTFGKAGAVIGSAPRMPDTSEVQRTPGPQYDPSMFLCASTANVHAGGMTKAPRDVSSSAALATPGPPAYLIKKDTAHYRYPASGGFSMAANLRTDFTVVGPGNDSPGPAAHGGHTTFSAPGANASAPPSTLGL